VDFAVVVNSWLLYSGGWSPTMRWGRQLKPHNFNVYVCGHTHRPVLRTTCNSLDLHCDFQRTSYSGNVKSEF
jgi:hypothetical protein